MNKKLSTAISDIYALTGLNIFVLEKNNRIEPSLYNELSIGRLIDETVHKSFSRKCLLEAEEVYLYVITNGKTTVFIGPVSHHELNSKEVHTYKKRYPISTSMLSMCKEKSVYSAISLLSLVILKKEISLSEIISDFSLPAGGKYSQKEFLDEQIDSAETFNLNHSSQREQQFIELVKSGNTNEVRKMLEDTVFLFPSPVSDKRKNYEYMVVSLVTVLCRAAISGGAPANLAFSQSDVYLKLISECNTTDEINNVAHDAAITFTNMVASNQNIGDYSLTSARCRKLIHSQLLNPVTLSSLAKELSVSKEYLASSFKKDFGITVTDYINKKKSELACRLLSDTSYSVQEIAAYLCYNSTSYFIKVFKENVGITPGNYALEFAGTIH